MAIIVPIVSSWNPQGLDRAIADIKRAEGAFNTFTAATAGIGGVMRNTGRAMSYNLSLPLGLVGANAIQTAADFEVTMAQIGVATNTPVAGLKNLSDLAKQLGQDTIFSSKEAAGAMLELSKAGISPAEIQAGALKNTLDLAAASGMSLQEAAITMSAGMNTFGLEAENSVLIVDALAGAANASSADLFDIAIALQQTGQQAVASGLTIQETTAALAAFADAGVRGSDAGTSFKTFLQRLNPVSKEAAKKMQELGLEFFDANGNMKDLTDIAGELQTGFAGLTQEQRLATMQTIFGSDSLRAANILFTEGSAGIQEYITATSESGNAQKMAEARMSGLAGALESLKGSIETASQVLGEAMAPTIEKVAGFVKGLFDRFSELSPQMQTVIATILMAVVAAGPMLWIFGALIKSIGTMAIAIKALGTALSFLVANPIGLTILALAAIGYAIYQVVQNWDLLKEKAGAVVGAVVGFAKNMWSGITGWFDKIGDSFVSVGRDIVQGLRDGITNSWESFKNWFKDLIGSPIKWAKDILKIKSPSQVFAGIGKNTIEGFIKGAEGMTATLQTSMSNVAMDSGVAFNGAVAAAPSSSASSNAVYNINISAGMGADGAQIGREIVDAIKRYERASGPVFASA